jgi:hypothetical protein
MIYVILWIFAIYCALVWTNKGLFAERKRAKKQPAEPTRMYEPEPDSTGEP